MIKFLKMNGNGNNFLIMENFGHAYSDEKLSALAVKVCNTKHSIGADGVLVVEESDIADFKMRLFNSNGLEGEMCGNGSRCIAKYALMNNLAKESMRFETLAGIIEADVLGEEVRILIGEVGLNEIEWDKEIKMEDRIINYSYLVVGVPHCVVYTDTNKIGGLEDMESIGRFLDNNKEAFPRGVNTNFVEFIDDHTIKAITYERGVEDITESCGTGSCASTIVSTIHYKMKSPVLVKNMGGDNKVWFEFNESTKLFKIYLQGKVDYCAEVNLIEKDS